MSHEKLTNFTNDSAILWISVPESLIYADTSMLIVHNVSGAVKPG